MSLTPLLQDLKAREQNYEASETTREKLAGKVLTAIVAPTAVGKSTLIQRALDEGGSNFSESYSVVTRHRRATDPAGYKTKDEGYDIKRVKAMIETHELTHYTIHPSGNIYGSLPDSFPTPYNFLPCVPSILNVVNKAGFSTVHTVYIVVQVQQWQERLPARQHESSYTSRLAEAIESLTWALDHAAQLSFVENATGALDKAALTILALTRGEPVDLDPNRGVALAADMLAFVHSELDRLKR